MDKRFMHQREAYNFNSKFEQWGNSSIDRIECPCGLKLAVQPGFIEEVAIIECPKCKMWHEVTYGKAQ